MVDQVYEGFWMKPAYRMPDNDCACIEPGTTPAATRPIGRFNVRSFITSVQDGAQRARRPADCRCAASPSTAGRASARWPTPPTAGRAGAAATLGDDLGRYSFREFTFGFTPDKGAHDLRVRAWNRSGQSQPMEALWQPAGYMRNVVERSRSPQSEEHRA